MAPISPPLHFPAHLGSDKIAGLVQLRTMGLLPELAWNSPDPPQDHPSWSYWSSAERGRFFGYMRDAYPEYEFPFTEETLFADSLVLPPPSYFDGDLKVVRYRGDPDDVSHWPERPRPNDDWLDKMTGPDTGAYGIFEDVELPGLSDPPVRYLHAVDVSDLSFNRTTTLSALEEHAETVRRNVSYHLEKKKYLEAAYLHLVSLQHSVIVIDSNYPMEARINAVQSFPDDVFGPWAPPQGDIVILPGFHGSTTACQRVLKEIKEAFTHLRKTKGNFRQEFKVKSCYDHELMPGVVHCDLCVDETAMRMGYLMRRISIDGAPVKNALFRPVFSKFMFRIGSVKMRLAVELLQMAIIALLKAVDAALLRCDIGAALYLVQLLRQAVVRFLWMLRYKPLQASYLFGLHKFFEGKCYALYYFNPVASQRYVEVRNIFAGAEKTFEELDEEFHEELSSTSDLALTYECEIRLPSTSMNCLAVAYQAFYGVAITPKWKRVWKQKEVVAITYLSRHLRYWKFCVVSDYVRIDQDRRLNHLNRIGLLLDGAVSEPRLSRLCRACLFLLNAQLYQLRNVWQQACTLNSMVRGRHAVRYATWSSSLDVRAKSMRGAMLELADELQRPPPETDHLRPKQKVLRSMYVLVATKTFCDGVFDQLLYHSEVNKVYDTCFQPLLNIMTLLRDCMEPWVDKPYLEATGLYRLKVHQAEEVFVNQILGVFFYGTALIYFRVIGGNTPTTTAQRNMCKNNATFFLALAMSYLRRPGVAGTIMRRVSDLALTYDRCFIQVAMKKLRGLVERATTVLNIFFFLLPMLWELCIDAVEDEPVNHTEISIRTAALSLPLKDIEKKAGKEQIQIFEALLSYVKADLDLDGSHPVILRGHSESPAGNPEDVEHIEHPCDGELSTFKFNFKYGNYEGEKRPPIPSRYSWGAHHKVELHLMLFETLTSGLQPFYTESKLKSLLGNFNGQVFTDHDDLEIVAKDIMANISFLCSLMDDSMTEDGQKLFMTTAANIELQPSDVSAALRMYRVYKMQPTSSLVCLTRTMVKLEKVLCGGALTSLMRGQMD